MSRFFLSLLFGCGLFLLAACEDEATKAERYFQSGLQLIEEGDPDRALVELRNVFLHDGFHRKARETYAALVLEMGREQEAYSQYLRLIEQYPDATDARVILAELAIARGNWPEAERHGTAAIEQAPDRADVRAIDLVLKYRQASLDDDAAARATIAQDAQTLLTEIRAEDGAENRALARVIIDNDIRSDRPREALEAVDAALQYDETDEELQTVKARLLTQLEETEALGAHLRKMITLFPENTQVRQAMINWFLTQNDIEGAETFLREQAGSDTTDPQDHMAVIQLLQSTQGVEAARAEISRLKDANTGTENGRFYAAMLATLDFDAGEREQALADLRTIIENSETGPQKNRLRITLAQMLVTTGDEAGVAQLVGEVLTDDPGNVPALQMQAARLIREDKPGEAIVALRRALDQNPRDVETLTLMAQAHERDGDANLAGERLALAMEVSGNAPTEAMRYARFLIGQNRQQVALNVLEDARTRAPNDPQVLTMLARLYSQSADWPQAQGIVNDLRQIDTPDTRQAATELESLILQAQNRTEESLRVLENQLGQEKDASVAQKIRSTLLILRARIRDGDPEGARETLDAALEESPDSPDLQMLDAGLLAISGDFTGAETIYRNLMERFPQNELPARLLIGLLSNIGQRDEAIAVLDAAIDRMPQQSNLLWIKAGILEGQGDIDGAIAIYDDIYTRDSGNQMVANNLASLLTTYKDDPESLNRAANIARRLRGTNVPAFQDTYGWIAYRRENYDEALTYLEPAAAGLSDNALVQYHLGMTYAALERTAEAETALTRALELAGDSTLPQFDRARETLKEISGAP